MKVHAIVISLAIASIVHRVEGEDIFESLILFNCFQPREVIGCSGTLLDNFQPKSKGAGLNKPDTKIFLFTQDNPVKAEFLHECGGMLPMNTNFNPDATTEIFIPGFVDGPCRSAYWREIRDQLLLRGPYNVILVDWNWGNSLDYYGSILNGPVVGEQVAFVIKNIMKQKGVSPESFHVTGHSSGAHLSGYVGQNLPRLGRITGLDPGGPGYIGKPPDQRLDKSDALLVDIIHTSAAYCDLIGFGYPEPSGHADFYVNGGTVQLSCYPDALFGILREDFATVVVALIPPICSHTQAIPYYKASINPGDCLFVGVECPDYKSFKSGSCRSCGKDGSRCAVMGFDFDKFYKDDGRNHTYYLDTKLLCPYCDPAPYRMYKNAISSSNQSATKRPRNYININNLR